jgi:hypothetical protein
MSDNELRESVARYLERSTQIGDCLVGPGARYGVVNYSGGRQMAAHRASYIVHRGPIPDGMVVRHSCDNPPCVNPDHLLVGTHRDNERDKWERGRGPLGLQVYNATITPELIREAVAEYLRGGKSQAEMARRLGVGQTTFGRWVRAEARPDSGVEGVTLGRGARIATGLKPCGTRAGAARHRREGETPCPSCREADRAYMREYKAKRAALGRAA